MCVALYDIKIIITRIVCQLIWYYNYRISTNNTGNYIMTSYKVANKENRITIGARAYHTCKSTLLEPGDKLVYSLLIDNVYASPSHGRVKCRYNTCSVINLPVISDTRGAYVELEESVIDFFETEIIPNLDTRFVIPIDILSEYDTHYDYEKVAKLFVELCNKYNVNNVVLPIEWTDYEAYKKIYVYTHMSNNRFTRQVLVGNSFKEVVAGKYTSECYDVEVKFLGITYSEHKTGWVVI